MTHPRPKFQEQTIADMQAEIDAEEGNEERQIVSLLSSLAAAREQKAYWTKQEEDLSKPVKDYLVLHDQRQVFDGETGIGFHLEERSSTATYETERMSDELILALHKAHALKVDSAVLKALNGHQVAEDAKVYQRPGLATTALMRDRV